MRRWLTLLLATLPLGCRPPTATEDAAAPSAPSASGATLEPSHAQRLESLLAAELDRDPGALTSEDFASPLRERRLAAARAAARIGGAVTHPWSLRALGDEDPEIGAWGAFGAGESCAADEVTTVRALVSRAALLAVRSPGEQEPGRQRAIAGALARCATPEAEANLRAWLARDTGLAEAAAFGLGLLARRRGKLSDATVVALLDAAAEGEPPLAEALLPFAVLPPMEPAVTQRLLEVARARLEGSEEARLAALQALGSAGSEAAPVLRDVLLTGTQPSERILAAKQLGRLGVAGQRALLEALDSPRVDPSAPDATPLLELYPIAAAALEALAPPVTSAALERLAGASLDGVDAAPLRRRWVLLRCRAAELVAGAQWQAPILTRCDPDPLGTTGRLAGLRALGRQALRGPRARAWLGFARDAAPLVRQAALELGREHPELSGAAPAFAEALTAPHAGTVGIAAQVLAEQPALARRGDDAADPDPRVTAALTEALAKQRAPGELSTSAALARAAGALQLLSVKPKLEALCQAPFPLVRDAAQQALRQLGDRGRQCAPVRSGFRLGRPAAAGPVELVLRTDVGEVRLKLDPRLAPAATERARELAERHYYDGLSWHRVVPGFVAQFGERDGDGAWGEALPPLPSEPSPRPFGALDVGVAQSGRDTGNTQLFITLLPSPWLTGDYTWLGTASGPVDRLAPGDVIQAATVAAAP